MERKCRKCGKTCNIKLTKYFKVLLKRKMNFMCETCEAIDDWKNNKILYHRSANCFTWNACTVECYDVRLHEWIKEKIINPKKYCEIKMKSGFVYHCFPVKLKEDYLTCCKDEYNPKIENGTHRMGTVEKSVPLNYIEGIKILDVYKDYVEPDVKEPVYGFKGVYLKDGILKSNKYIYEIGIPYEEPQRNPHYTDYQDVYSHFCRSIEDVLLYRDFITSPIVFSQGKDIGEIRLFKVKGEGHCFKNTETGWVSNKLTLVREVSKEEIVTYFNETPNLKILIQKYFYENKSIYKDTWEEYLKADIKPYKAFMDDNEIENMLINHCEYNKMGYCAETPKWGICQECNYYAYDMKKKRATYCYLTVRNAIRGGTFDETDINYLYLLEHNNRSKLEAIQRLLKYR